MGNIAFVSSKRNLDADRVSDDLDEINERRFGGFFNVFVPHDDAWDIGYADDKGEHQSLWYWHLESKRKIGGKHPRPNYLWVLWAWSVFQAELGAKWGGRISDEGVEGTWSPTETLERCTDLPTYMADHYSWMKDDHPHREQVLAEAVDQIERTLPKGLYRHAFPNPVAEMKDYVRETFATFGVDFKFEADDELTKYRRGKQLTMGELRALDDGAVVWLYIYYKESVRADSAYRIEERDGCWVFDDGSSFGADFVDEEGPDEDWATDEYSQVYAAVPDKQGAERAVLLERMRDIVSPRHGALTEETIREMNEVAAAFARLDRSK